MVYEVSKGPFVRTLSVLGVVTLASFTLSSVGNYSSSYPWQSRPKRQSSSEDWGREQEALLDESLSLHKSSSQEDSVAAVRGQDDLSFTSTDEGKISQNRDDVPGAPNSAETAASEKGAGAALSNTKDFVYLINSPRWHELSPPLRSNFKRDLIWRTFEEPVESGYPHIFEPRAFYTEGRNLALNRAIQVAAETQNQYKYYIFMDDDVVSSAHPVSRQWQFAGNMSANPYERFEEFLQTYEPAIGYGNHHLWGQEPDMNSPFTLHHNFDHCCFVAVHREALSFVAPYNAHFEKVSGWASQAIFNALVSFVYTNRRMQCNSVQVVNPSHRDFGSDFVRHITGEERLYLAEGILCSSKYRKGFPLTDPRNIPGNPALRKNSTYIVPDRFIEENLDTSHEWVKNLLEFRSRPHVKCAVLGIIECCGPKANESIECQQGRVATNTFEPDPVIWDTYKNEDSRRILNCQSKLSDLGSWLSDLGLW
eukprot:CAMPEP_0184492652 /NCGR_PEP_ID=MMETSP0113_2-20130426/23911_1 /TAXON_ID=91329 /ORGANISM="Norrisiella sphaerica, Strain BC52" /LENGTH=479 /DNA_ID=CAMNT_0026877581 /DNA_START=130 /DNA_END=1566 /DNA_ORIENTATION=-